MIGFDGSLSNQAISVPSTFGGLTWISNIIAYLYNHFYFDYWFDLFIICISSLSLYCSFLLLGIIIESKSIASFILIILLGYLIHLPVFLVSESTVLAIFISTFSLFIFIKKPSNRTLTLYLISVLLSSLVRYEIVGFIFFQLLFILPIVYKTAVIKKRKTIILTIIITLFISLPSILSFYISFDNYSNLYLKFRPLHFLLEHGREPAKTPIIGNEKIEIEAFTDFFVDRNFRYYKSIEKYYLLEDKSPISFIKNIKTKNTHSKLVSLRAHTHIYIYMGIILIFLISCNLNNYKKSLYIFLGFIAYYFLIIFLSIHFKHKENFVYGITIISFLYIWLHYNKINLKYLTLLSLLYFIPNSKLAYEKHKHIKKLHNNISQINFHISNEITKEKKKPIYDLWAIQILSSYKLFTKQENRPLQSLIFDSGVFNLGASVHNHCCLLDDDSYIFIGVEDDRLRVITDYINLDEDCNLDFNKISKINIIKYKNLLNIEMNQ